MTDDERAESNQSRAELLAEIAALKGEREKPVAAPWSKSDFEAVVKRQVGVIAGLRAEVKALQERLHDEKKAAEQALATVTAERDSWEASYTGQRELTRVENRRAQAAEQQVVEVQGRFDAAVLSHEILERERNEAQRQLAEVRGAISECPPHGVECPTNDTYGEACSGWLGGLHTLIALPPRRTEEP